MNDLLASAPFEDVNTRIHLVCETIRTSSVVHIHAPADAVWRSQPFLHRSSLLSTLALPYAAPVHAILIGSLPRDEVVHPQQVTDDGCLLFLRSLRGHLGSRRSQRTSHTVHITPVAVTVRLGAGKGERQGALDVVAQCAAIASVPLPQMEPGFAGFDLFVVQGYGCVRHWIRPLIQSIPPFEISSAMKGH